MVILGNWSSSRLNERRFVKPAFGECIPEYCHWPKPLVDGPHKQGLLDIFSKNACDKISTVALTPVIFVVNEGCIGEQTSLFVPLIAMDDCYVAELDGDPLVPGCATRQFDSVSTAISGKAITGSSEGFRLGFDYNCPYVEGN